MTQPYARAPITEAVVEFRIADPLSDAALDVSRRRFAKRYSKAEQLMEWQLNLQPGNSQVGEPHVSGFRFTNGEARYAVNTGRSGCSLTALAPYEGWEEFDERLRETWGVWAKAVGRQKLTRIGMRYVNRLDIPVTSQDEPWNRAEYLNVGVDIPSFGHPLTGFVAQSFTRIGRERFGLNLTASTMQPVLLDHGALVLDIDVYADVDVPQRDADIWTLMEALRSYKNQVFEACITDAARELIR